MQIRTMQTEKIQARIETYTSNLAQAVQSGSGAQFSLLLSMIATNQDLPGTRPQAIGEGFELPTTDNQYPDPNDLYSADVAERMNVGINQDMRGEFAYACSYVETESLVPVKGRRLNDSLERLGLISGGAMLQEIASSHQQIRQTA